MAKPGKLSQNEINKMKKLRKMGYSFGFIGRTFGTNDRIAWYHTNSVVQIKNKIRQKYNPITKEQIKNAVKLRKKGFSVPDIAKILNRPSVTIFFVLKKQKQYKRFKNV